MIIIEILLAVILVGICLYAVVSDVKIGKIRNDVLVIFGIVALVLVLIKFIFFSQDDILIFLKNAGIVILFSLIGYATRIWAGGDCKLALFIGLVYPTLFYYDYNGGKVTLWVFVALAFVLGFLYIIVDSVLVAVKDKKSVRFVSAVPILKASLMAYLKCFIYLTAFNQIYSMIVYSYFSLSPILYFVVSIVFVYVVSMIKVLQKIWVVSMVALFDVIIMLATNNYAIIEYWYNYVLVIALLIIRALVSKYNYSIIKTEDVTEGMVLSKVDTMFMHQYNIKGMPDISDETLRSRITFEEAQLIRRWGKTKHGKKELTIVRKVPFASFMSIGLIVYLLMGVLHVCGLT